MQPHLFRSSARARVSWMVTVEGHSIPLPAEAGDYPGARAEKGKEARPSSGCGIWTRRRFKTLGSLWWILIPPKIPECSSSRTVGTDEGRELPEVPAVRFRPGGGRTSRKETAVRSRDAHISSRSDRLCARPPVLDAEVVGGWGTKADQDRLPLSPKWRTRFWSGSSSCCA